MNICIQSVERQSTNIDWFHHSQSTDNTKRHKDTNSKMTQAILTDNTQAGMQSTKQSKSQRRRQRRKANKKKAQLMESASADGAEQKPGAVTNEHSDANKENPVNNAKTVDLTNTMQKKKRRNRKKGPSKDAKEPLGQATAEKSEEALPQTTEGASTKLAIDKNAIYNDEDAKSSDNCECNACVIS